MQANWRPFFWEPVLGSGERLMAGVVMCYDGEWVAQRMLRDDVLASLYGKAAANPKRLIDEALNLLLAIVKHGGIEALASLEQPLMGLHPGRTHCTDVTAQGDALRQAVLLYSSLSQVDGWDELEEIDAPAPEEVNKRFATEVRDILAETHPALVRNFSRSAYLIQGGKPVKFGYFSNAVVLHFSVLHPARQSASVRDARARLWELSRAKETANIAKAALITAVPRSDDPTLGMKQHASIKENKVEIEREADAVEMRFITVTNASEAAQQVIALEA